MNQPPPIPQNLRQCKACTGTVSKHATTCPHCGHPQIIRTSPSTWFWWLCVLVGLPAFLVLLWIAIPADTGVSRQGSSARGPAVTVENVRAIAGEYSTEIKGAISNATSVRLRRLAVKVNIYNPSGSRVGTASDYLSDLEPYGTWEFKAVYFGRDFDTFKLDAVTCNYGRIY